MQLISWSVESANHKTHVGLYGGGSDVRVKNARSAAQPGLYLDQMDLLRVYNRGFNDFTAGLRPE